MKTSASDKTNRSEHDSSSKPRHPALRSPRAEAFKAGLRTKREDVPDDPFDPRRYREIYSETD